VKKRLSILLKVTIATIALLIVLCLLHRAYWQAKFKRQVAELKTEGVPISFNDLDNLDMLPEGSPNAADVYLLAFLHYQEPDESLIPYLPVQGDYEIVENNHPLPKEVIDAIEASLEANKQTLALLDQGATIEHCVFPRERPLNIDNQELLVNLRNCGYLLCNRNLYLAQTHQIEKLITAMSTLLKFSESPIRCGTLIDEMVAIGLKNMAVESLEDILNQITFTDSQLTHLQQQFSGAQDLEACYRNFIKERVVYLESVLSPFNERPTKQDASTRRAERVHSMVGLMQKEHVMHLDYFQRFIDASLLPLEDRPDALNEITVELADSLPSWQIYLDSLLLLVNIADIDTRVIEYLRCAETALAIERYRLKYGSLPDSLDKLVSEFMTEVPLEPFDGEPLRYIRHHVGYTVYMIGEDGVDNGGLSKEQMKEKTGEEEPEEYDWPFTVRR